MAHKLINMNVETGALARIDAEAHRLHLTRTAYMVNRCDPGAYPMPGQQPAVRVNAEAIIRRAMKITRVPPTPTAVPIPTKATVAATAKALGASLGPGAVKVRVPERFGPLAGVQLGPTASKPGSRLKTK